MKKLKGVKISRRRVLKVGALTTVALTSGLLPGRLLKAATVEDTPENPNQMGFMYDQQLCIGCGSCGDACSKANDWEEGTKWRRILQVKGEYVYLSISCNHCEKPACLEVCPVKAYTKREKDGISGPSRCTTARRA